MVRALVSCIHNEMNDSCGVWKTTETFWPWKEKDVFTCCVCRLIQNGLSRMWYTGLGAQVRDAFVRDLCRGVIIRRPLLMQLPQSFTHLQKQTLPSPSYTPPASPVPHPRAHFSPSSNPTAPQRSAYLSTPPSSSSPTARPPSSSIRRLYLRK